MNFDKLDRCHTGQAETILEPCLVDRGIHPLLLVCGRDRMFDFGKEKETLGKKN